MWRSVCKTLWSFGGCNAAVKRFCVILRCLYSCKAFNLQQISKLPILVNMPMNRAVEVESFFQKRHIILLHMVWQFGPSSWPQDQGSVAQPPSACAYGLAGSTGLRWYTSHCRHPAYCQVTPTHRHTITEVGDGMETVVVFEQFWLMQFLSCFRLFASGVSPAAGCANGVKHCMTESHFKKHCRTAT